MEAQADAPLVNKAAEAQRQAQQGDLDVIKALGLKEEQVALVSDLLPQLSVAHDLFQRRLLNLTATLAAQDGHSSLAALDSCGVNRYVARALMELTDREGGGRRRPGAQLRDGDGGNISQATGRPWRKQIGQLSEVFGFEDDAWITARFAVKLTGLSGSALNRWEEAGIISCLQERPRSVRWYLRGELTLIAGDGSPPNLREVRQLVERAREEAARMSSPALARPQRSQPPRAGGHGFRP
ncbi:hypothetical protein [Spirillospora sp. CA-294931]|uniref:hypothetical protein n=1 Tax=Spirillospora sp. CA-294931 TaxID=3240042 RepID=UPI003D9478DA